MPATSLVALGLIAPTSQISHTTVLAMKGSRHPMINLLSFSVIGAVTVREWCASDVWNNAEPSKRINQPWKLTSVTTVTMKMTAHVTKSIGSHTTDNGDDVTIAPATKPRLRTDKHLRQLLLPCQLNALKRNTVGELRSLTYFFHISRSSCFWSGVSSFC